MKNFLKIYTLFCLILIQTNCFAASQEIVAIINNQSVTSYDLEQIKKMIIALYPKDHNISQKQLEEKALDVIVRNNLIMKNSVDLGILVPDDEILNAILILEKQNNLKTGHYQNLMKKNKIDIQYLQNNIKAELILKKILYSFAGSESATKDETDRLLLAQNLKNMDIELKVFTSKDISNGAYKKMNKLYKVLNDCENLPNENWFKKFANLDQIQDASSLSPMLFSSVKFLSQNDRTSVIKTDQGFQICMMCRKDTSKLSEKDISVITQTIINNKIMRHFKRFQNNLRHKGYVKIMEI